MRYLWAALLLCLLSCDDKPEKAATVAPPPPDPHNLQVIEPSFDDGVSSFDDTFHGIPVRCYVYKKYSDSGGIACVLAPKE